MARNGVSTAWPNDVSRWNEPRSSLNPPTRLPGNPRRTTVLAAGRAALCEPRGGRANGPEVNPRGQGPRGYGSAAHGLPACESTRCRPRAAVQVLTFRAGSAGGPKPGRAGFYLELGRRWIILHIPETAPHVSVCSLPPFDAESHFRDHLEEDWHPRVSGW